MKKRSGFTVYWLLFLLLMAFMLQSCATNKYSSFNNGCWKGPEPKHRMGEKMRG